MIQDMSNKFTKIQAALPENNVNPDDQLVIKNAILFLLNEQNPS